MFIIVTGSAPRNGEHDFTEDPEFYGYVTEVLQVGIEHVNGIFVGDAKGVDAVALDVARTYDIEYEVFRAEWDTYGRAAGPIRNERMIRTTIEYAQKYEEPLVVLGFSNKPIEMSRGTRNCLKQARQYGLTTHLFRTDLRKQEY